MKWRHAEMEPKYITSKCKMALYHIVVKSLNNLLRSFIFHNQDYVNQRKALFYLRVLLDSNFPQFDKSPGNYYSKTRQVKTKSVCKSIFFKKKLTNTAALKTQMIISRSLMEWDTITETRTMETDDVVSILSMLFRGGSRTPLKK